MSILNVEPNQLSWNVVRTLGEGAYGEVKLVVDSNNPNCAVAIKCIDLVKHPEVAETARKEALLMRRLRGHVNIIQYIGMRVDENTEEFQIFLEYADGGELFDQIEPDIGMSTQKAQFYFRQIIDGLEYIHSNGIAHRDIKPENLLLTKQDVLKISDFGMATMFRHNGRERMLETKCGTLPYCSPEILKTRYRAEPSDIWSCGIVLVALLAGELPWDSPTQECDSFRRWNESTNLDHAPWNKISTVALSLLRTILNSNPSRRATIARIRQHPWFIKDFSKERCMLRVNSNSSTGDYHSMECPIKRRKRSLNTLFERDYDPESMSQPTIGTITDNSSELPCNNPTIAASNCQIESFSQPENIEMLLLNYSQVDHNQQTLQCADPLQRLVRRMTRFCVTKKITATEAMVHIGSACETCGYSIRFGPANKMTVHHTKDRREMSFVVTIYEMVDNNGRKVLVDFRRSKGDGIEFKRTFVHLKKKLMSIVCGESTAWLTLQGLVCNQELNQLSLDAESA